MKRKLDIDGIISDMKSKGITFNHISEADAKEYLSSHTYYFKFKSYAKNYTKNTTTNKYIGLDFSYLQDLARLDMYFREIVFKLTVDIEHLLKVQIMEKSQKTANDNGYKVVSDYISQNDKLRNRIEERINNNSDSYNTALLKKNYPQMPIWVLLEIMTFGELTDFYSFYTTRFPIGNNVSDYLWHVRVMRNAAAHNSCILNRLHERTSENKVNYLLRSSIKRTLPFIDTKKLKNYLTNPVLQDFMDILMVFRILDKSRTILNKRVHDIDEFFNRCKKNKEYYKNNPMLSSALKFAEDFICQYKKSL